eukprot:441293-Ditylum_brightwellii.AAC.1
MECSGKTLRVTVKHCDGKTLRVGKDTTRHNMHTAGIRAVSCWRTIHFVTTLVTFQQQVV